MPLYNSKPEFVNSSGVKFVPITMEDQVEALRICRDWNVRFRRVKVQRTDFRKKPVDSVPPPLEFIFIESTGRALGLFRNWGRQREI